MAVTWVGKNYSTPNHFPSNIFQDWNPLKSEKNNCLILYTISKIKNFQYEFL